MEIQQQSQYNQTISRYKLLSSNAGAGSVITTGTGNYVLISDIGQWPFIKTSNGVIKDLMNDGVTASENWYEKAKKDIMNTVGVECVDDERFVQFLKVEKDLERLLCLAVIPQLSLNENFNSLNKKDNPIIKKLADKGINKDAKDFAIPATHFPKWFKNDKGILKPYQQWKEDWKRAGMDMRFFAPPRDAGDRFPYKLKIKQEDKLIEVDACKILTQNNLILICENGHLSDIPWPKFLRWRTDLRRSRSNEKGATLFTDIDNCCSDPLLKWSESKNRSEGYASIYIECINCGMGNGKDASHPKINLEGINNLEPFCLGHKPWEVSLDDNNNIPSETGCCNKSGQRSTMQVALVTGNNVYFANTFSSIYIPNNLLKGVSPEVDRLLRICEQKYSSLTEPGTKGDWAERRINKELLQEYKAKVDDPEAAIQQVKAAFIKGSNGARYKKDDDLHEVYRKEEYDVFSNYRSYPNNSTESGLVFTDMLLNDVLVPYFKKIQKIEELKITSVQLDFNRVTPNERIIAPDGKVVTGNCKNIFSNAPEEVLILPAVENYGEGIFFEFNGETLEKWNNTYDAALSKRIASLMPTGGSFNGNSLRRRIEINGAKLLLIHTFSHLIMRELEFSCGYPTASLKERLYISPEMSGVLIYTADGSEGSMGGLIWQVQPERMTKLIAKAMERALDCSSDPLCWEDEGQGLFNLNLSACFSCTLVSETACEERNLSLDRRILIDPEFGYFSPMVQ